jgi:predicted lipid-binding transport protein (Tim44 family)
MSRAAVLLTTFLLVLTPDALAAAGGGSSGFGGGGGGGGGGGFGGGSGGSGGSMPWWLVVLIVLGVLIAAAYSAYKGWRWRRKRDARVLRVQLAAAEAAEDDAAFAVDRVTTEARDLFCQIQAAWSAEDRKKLHRLCSADLCVEWERRLDDFAGRGWHNKVEVNGDPEVHYVGLVNRADDKDDRVCVLIEASLTDYVEDNRGRRIKRNDSTSTTTTLREYWTLSKRDGAWRLLSIEQFGEGGHNLDSELVASPWSDGRLREDAVLEGAAADAAGSPSDVATLVDLDYAEDGRKAALDLSLVDGRFAPDVLETSAKRAVAAWAEAVDGPDAALERVASPHAISQLLYPTGDDAVRRVVRGPQVQSMTLVKLDGSAEPPSMLVELKLSGRRYLENRDTVAVVSGSRDSETSWTERWTFSLGDDAQAPWQVTSAGDAPVRA